MNSPVSDSCADLFSQPFPHSLPFDCTTPSQLSWTLHAVRCSMNSPISDSCADLFSQPFPRSLPFDCTTPSQLTSKHWQISLNKLGLGVVVQITNHSSVEIQLFHSLCRSQSFAASTVDHERHTKRTVKNIPIRDGESPTIEPVGHLGSGHAQNQ